MPRYYLLGGRAFRSAATQSTFAQDGYLRGVLATNKLHDVVQAGGDVYAVVAELGCESKLLAGLLVEDGKGWNRDDALANVAHFEGITAPEEKLQLLDALALILSDFFPFGGSSSTASPTSSPAPARRRPRRRRTATTPVNAAENGPASSPNSPSPPASG